MNHSTLCGTFYSCFVDRRKKLNTHYVVAEFLICIAIIFHVFGFCRFTSSMMVSINPTLVETVSINYEDFSESFLTCGTCLCMYLSTFIVSAYLHFPRVSCSTFIVRFILIGVYNGVDHIPKLLPCSHTVCLDCLNRIADVRSREIGVFRCPICRELTNIPQGGISALPPSFLVNRLLDLMSRQRRHIIPTCSDHSNQVFW